MSAKLLGTVVRNPVTAGQPLTNGALVGPNDRGFLAAALGPGMRAVTVPVSSPAASPASSSRATGSTWS
jgi:pilus assembly protein CpaB